MSESEDGLAPGRPRASEPAWAKEEEAELAALAGELRTVFAAAAMALPPQSERVRAALRQLRPVSAARPQRTLLALFTLYGCAAALLLLAWLGYTAVYRIALRDALAHSTRLDMRNLGLALERWAREHGGALPIGDSAQLLALLSQPGRDGRTPVFEVPRRWIRDGRLTDAFGRPLRYRALGERALLYSCGPNGRDDGGAADDIVVWLRSPGRGDTGF